MRYLVFALLLGSTSFGMEACPEGTTPWHFMSISLFLGYVVTVLLLTLFIYRKMQQSTKKRKIVLLLLTLLSATFLVISSLGLFINISWTGVCR